MKIDTQHSLTYLPEKSNAIVDTYSVLYTAVIMPVLEHAYQFWND